MKKDVIVEKLILKALRKLKAGATVKDLATAFRPHLQQLFPDAGFAHESEVHAALKRLRKAGYVIPSAARGPDGREWSAIPGPFKKSAGPNAVFAEGVVRGTAYGKRAEDSTKPPFTSPAGTATRALAAIRRGNDPAIVMIVELTRSLCALETALQRVAAYEKFLPVADPCSNTLRRYLENVIKIAKVALVKP